VVLQTLLILENREDIIYSHDLTTIFWSKWSSLWSRCEKICDRLWGVDDCYVLFPTILQLKISYHGENGYICRIQQDFPGNGFFKLGYPLINLYSLSCYRFLCSLARRPLHLAEAEPEILSSFFMSDLDIWRLWIFSFFGQSWPWSRPPLWTWQKFVWRTCIDSLPKQNTVISRINLFIHGCFWNTWK